MDSLKAENDGIVVNSTKRERSILFRSREPLFDNTGGEADPALFNQNSYEENEKNLYREPGAFFIIRFHKRFKILWNALIVILCFYLIIAIPFLISFTPSFSSIFIWINLSIDGVFLIDIVFSLCTSYQSHYGEVKNHKKIIKRYLKSSFAIDLFSVLPFDLIISLFDYRNTDLFTAAWLINLLKVLNLRRTKKLLNYIVTSPLLNSWLKILELFLYAFIWAHLNTCIWFSVLQKHQEWESVISQFGLSEDIFNNSTDAQYYISFYYGVWLTVGNEVEPSTEIEYITASFLIISGSIGTAVLFGEICLLILKLNSAETAYQNTIDDTRSALEQTRIPNSLNFQVLEKLLKNESYLRTEEEQEAFVNFISPSIKAKIAQILYDPILMKNPVFSTESNIFNFLLDKMNLRFVKDEEEVITEGQEANSLFFLISGEIKVTSFNYAKQKTEKVCFLQPGSHFGEIGLIYGGARRASCISEGFSTVAELSRNNFRILSNQSPLIVPKLKEFTANYSDWTKEFLSRSLKFQKYFEDLPARVFNQIPFMMSLTKVEKDRFLFKPGDLCKEIIVLLQGKLELSVTLNDKYIQFLKIQEDIAGDSSIVKPISEALQANFTARKFDIFSVNGLKRKTEIFPYFSVDGKLKSSKTSEGVPLDARRLGSYLQEIILCTLNPGALINSVLMIFDHPLQLQCKAVESSLIATLSRKDFDYLTEAHFSFKKRLMKEKKKKEINSKNAQVFLDVFQDSSKKGMICQLFKENVLKVVFMNRMGNRKISRISGICNKIKAILACENAGEIELAESVMEGKISPDFITEDGKLISGSCVALPVTHPIIDRFKKNLKKLSDPKSTSINSYNKFAQEILNESNRVEVIKKELLIVKNYLQVFNERKKEDPNDEFPMKKNKNLLFAANK